jgi:DNA polymerase
VIFGEGNPDADILFIGEAPNSTEESSRSIFVGRAGEMLTNMIEKVLLIARSDVYLTNIVKCRPPNNRVPSPTEAHSCLPYLKKEIEAIEPKIIVTLGESAYHYLTGDDVTMAQIRGTINKQENYTIIPTYHPNYLLRNPSAKKESFADMKLIKHTMEELYRS